MNELTQGQFWYVTAAIAAVTFVLGLLVPRFWMTRKENIDVQQVNYQNSLKLVDQHDAVFTAYAAALKAYGDADDVNFDIFDGISMAGVKYFYQISLICDAIMSDKVDHTVRDNTLLSKIRDVGSRTLPHHYETLQKIAKANGFPYSGELRREDYKGIYAVTEKFGLAADGEHHR